MPIGSLYLGKSKVTDTKMIGFPLIQMISKSQILETALIHCSPNFFYCFGSWLFLLIQNLGFLFLLSLNCDLTFKKLETQFSPILKDVCIHKIGTINLKMHHLVSAFVWGSVNLGLILVIVNTAAINCNLYLCVWI